MDDSIHNKKQYKNIRKNLRNNLTPAEAGLWNYLKGKQLQGRKFRRQVSIGKYIDDFYCPEEKLVIELDGEVHWYDTINDNDKNRDIYLKKLGVTVLRFENKLIFEHLNSVLNDIIKHFKS